MFFLKRGLRAVLVMRANMRGLQSEYKGERVVERSLRKGER